MIEMESFITDGKCSSGPVTMYPQKALTFQQPNERELKNVARWIYCWNLWTELVRHQLELFHSESGVELSSPSANQAKGDKDTKESILLELQTHIVIKPVQTLSKVKTIRRIKEIGLKIDVWEKVRSEGVIYLSCLQIRLCEYKNGEHPMGKETYKMLELLQERFLEKIVTACQNIDFYYKEMESAINIFKNHRCNAIFINPIVTKCIEKFNKRIFQPIKIPGIVFSNNIRSETDSNLMLLSSIPPQDPQSKQRHRRKSKSKSKSMTSSSSYVPDVPDFIESLFAGRKPPKSKSDLYRSKSDSKKQENDKDGNFLDLSTTKLLIKHYIEIIQQGTEWYFAWSQFTEKVLQEIKSLAPALGSEVMNYMTKHIKHQITLLKGLTVEVRSIGNKTKKLTSSSLDGEMCVVITCLSILDDFVSLIESIKHEASYLIRYVEIALINLGVLDLNKEPSRIHPLRLYLMRNIISMKDCHLLTSIDYLYLEMGSLLEYTENRFHADAKYLEKFGQITADLLKKYTVNRKEAIQEKEFVNLQNFDTLELEKELRSSPTSNCLDLATSHLTTNPKFPMSRYQRAEDLRRWVEESKKTVQGITTDEYKDAEDGSDETKVMEGQTFPHPPLIYPNKSVSEFSFAASFCEHAWRNSSSTAAATGHKRLEEPSLQE